MTKHKRSSHKKTSRQLLAAVVVAAGLAIVWSTIFGWGAQITKNMFSQKRVSERLQIAADGTPVIVARNDANYLDVSRRTIDGKPWPNDYETWLGSAWFSAPHKKSGLIEFKKPWSERYSGGSDGKKPPTAWYLLRNAEPEGRAYFMGFDAFSKLPIGYIGSQGFRATPLPVAEHFTASEAQERNTLSSVGMVSTQYFDSWEMVTSHRHGLSSESRIPQWLVYVTDADRLLEIDLRERSVRTALELPGIQNVKTISEVVPKTPEPNAPEPNTESEASVRANQPFRLASTGTWTLSLAAPTNAFAASGADKIKTETRFAILAEGRIVIYDPPTNTQREFLLPAEENLVHKDFQASLIGPEKLLVQYGDGYWEQGPAKQVLWLTADGKVERRECVELAGYTPTPERTKAWKTARVMPLPIAWLGKTLGYDPMKKLQYHKADNYAAALRSSAEVAWPPIVAVVLLALVTAGVAMRWHRKYRRPHAGRWWLMVFLFGPVGLLAYWLQQKRTVLESCTSCDQIVPRDREACAACGQDFPAAELRGTEIFA